MPESATPANKELYEQVKKEIWKKYPIHSAYRSGLLVQEYKTKEDKKTASGIIIPETATAEDVKMGKVIAVGEGLYTQNGVLIPMSIKVGDEVILPSYTQSQEIKIDKEKYTLYREAELLAVLIG
jgi:chaperonin GroES